MKHETYEIKCGPFQSIYIEFHSVNASAALKQQNIPTDCPTTFSNIVVIIQIQSVLGLK